MNSCVVQLEKETFPPDPVICLLEIYKNCSCGLPHLKAIDHILYKTEQRVTGAAATSET